MAGKLRVEEFLSEFGKALVAAQDQILRAALEKPSPIEGMRTAFSISETELEVKFVFEEEAAGTVIRPVTSSMSRSQGLNSGALSTLKARILVVPDESAKTPNRAPSDVEKEIRQRPDLLRLQRVFGNLAVKAEFVPSAGRWIVDVVEPGGLTVRSLQVADSRPAGASEPLGH